MRRTKLLLICEDIEKERDECLEWTSVLQEHLGKNIKCFIEERRIETPYAIIDFVWNNPLIKSGYEIILHSGENDEKVLRVAIGEEND